MMFAPGDIFASRYRMIARIGRGGMGDVWRADDLVLETPVALKLIDAAGPAGRARILQEVRLARQITHPAVCRVFDVGEAGGEIFFSMELVPGEDLATLLGRVGRLPSEKVIEIGRQLCAGLAAAHARGVLHRDLKPANVLIDDNGAVRITDFGIAIESRETADHTLVGTPGYMAPEQLAMKPLSEQTDVYALGVVLYELVSGRHPIDRSGIEGPPPRLSALVGDVDPQLERVILQALSANPRDRPSSAQAMGASLPAVSSADGALQRPARRWLAAAGVAALVGVLALVVPSLLPRQARALNAQDTIVLADFMNTTGEPVFDGTLKVALAVALEQSPFLRVFPDDRVRDTLRLMDRSPDEPVTRSMAREIARREQLKALLAGSIGSLGRNYVIALEAINAETGDVMAREQVEAGGKEEVLGSLGRAASKLREKLGESLASIQQFDVPLPRATTASLEALNSYAHALDEGRVIARLEAIPHLKRALELDPDFALAQALLSGIYNNTGRADEAPELSRRAFELRDRVSERERFFISWRYYHDATQAWDKALELSRSWTATYPREAFAFNSLGIAAAAFGDYEQAIDALREALRLDPRFIPPYGNIVEEFFALNRLDEAKAILKQASDRGVDFISVRRVGYLLAFIENDSVTMARELKLALGTPEAVWASNWEARTAVFAGRLQTAHEQYRRGVQLALQGGFKEFAAQWTMEDAESHAVAGQCADARREVAAGLELNRNNVILERASRALALCGAGSEVAALTEELARRFPNATLTKWILLPVSTAALAVQRGESARALELLEPVHAYDHAPASEFWPSYLRGQAYIQLKNGQAASVEFLRIVDGRGEAPTSPLYALAHLGLGRAATLTGDVVKARKAYEDFLAIWREADSTLQPMKEARIEHDRLRQGEPAP